MQPGLRRRARAFLSAVLLSSGISLTRAEEAPARVIIITPHVDAIRHEFGNGFVRWHQKYFGQSVEVDWRVQGGTSDALRFVQSEFARNPDGIGLDVFFGGGQEPYYLLSDKKLVTPYQPAALHDVPASVNGVEIYDPKFTWYGAALSSFGILQNRKVQRIVGLPFVQRWEELADPRLRGWVGAGDPRNSGTMNVMFESFLQFYGWERGWQVLTQIAGNVNKFDRISSSTAKDVTLGETAYGFAIDFYGFSQIAVAGRTNMTFALPQDFTAVNADGITILKGAPHLVTAQRFVEFVLSEDGQRLWFLPKGHPEGPQRHSIERMVIRPSFYKTYKNDSNIEFSPFELNQQFRYDAKLGRARRDVVAALAGTLLVDTHVELREAWKAVIARNLPAPALAELGRVPLSEAAALDLARGAWTNAPVRNQSNIVWQTWAMKKYRRLKG